MAGIVVIATYRAKEGQAAAFEALLREHVPPLRREGYVTDRPGEVLRELQGSCLVEIFEWTSRDAAIAAANNATVHAHWDRMRAAADFVPHTELAEAKQPFCHFTTEG